jgi:hypothetical protein
MKKVFLFLLTISLLSIIPFTTRAQAFDDRNNHSWGLEVSLNYEGMSERTPSGTISEPNLGTVNYDGRFFGESFGLTVNSVYLYNLDRWLGMQTGLGFRGIFTSTVEGIESNFSGLEGTRNVFLVKVPMLLHLRPFKWVALECGFNNYFYLSHEDDFVSRKNMDYPEDFEAYFIQVQIGMRFWLVENFSLDVNYAQSPLPVATSTENDAYLDLRNISLGLRYMWPLK